VTRCGVLLSGRPGQQRNDFPPSAFPPDSVQLPDQLGAVDLMPSLPGCFTQPMIRELAKGVTFRAKRDGGKVRRFLSTSSIRSGVCGFGSGRPAADAAFERADEIAIDRGARGAAATSAAPAGAKIVMATAIFPDQSDEPVVLPHSSPNARQMAIVIARVRTALCTEA